ncbi:Benzoyl-CoA reductase/2-hydroxyglutaryl-CoA dehydratase subunit, BcrC/BadD/HgdB [Desulfosporosinus acidiphilus SJ4]|uniref:Benzoyl-CoA reductase/2-hydroxyglutaryl-CoA dehydratase subunit, BcrC/BadD/HgdB n=1 Tax=Desulfosporosinus acidiphilus (strain DSM 22704 / JCM 16185 / SJ4) TaxID=646529 RepID=I4D633_DESAJ|nr:2-hydroxyacyl-CoA dehydratase family protein [Desulfosporosinus acidiphilus]AFM41257.1 Benzoyl-CoA reductase/2-hydroxyglutaryl-CoA dehydratase subunit, BcrC/BadD/HgdB [Desulfosporosinus acidiphilus SJ4]
MPISANNKSPQQGNVVNQERKIRHYRPLKSNAALKKTMRRYYALTNYHRYWGKTLNRPLAWVTSGAPVELLRAFKIHPAYPEQYAAIYSTHKATVKLCEVAEAEGYSLDLCSYARSHLGGVIRPDLAPYGGMPKPDLLVACNNICGTVLKWYEVLARHFNIPLLVLDTPFLNGELTSHAKEYVLNQLQGMIDELEIITGRKFNENLLAQQMRFSSEITSLWKETRQLCCSIPSPLNAPDLFIHMAPIVVLRGSQAGIDYYRQLKNEVQERVAKSLGAIENERIRLVWDNIAIWPRIFSFYKLFAEKGACFVTDTYSGGWAVDHAPGTPLESLAATYTEVFLNRSPDYRAKQLISLIKEYKANGFVMHSNRSCKPYSLVQEVIRRKVMRETGVPGLMIEADMADPRVYADEPVRNRVQAFLETFD